MSRAKSRRDLVSFGYDRLARFYDTFSFLVELLVSGHRKEILRLARGSILELGVGTGSSFKDYPLHHRIVAVDVSQEMLRRADEKRTDYDGNVDLRIEDIQNLSFGDESFDTVFSSWVFCSVADPIKALREVLRVLKKDGQLLMLEHVRSKNRILGYLMDGLNPLATRLGIGNINRDTVQYLRRVGFKVRQERNIAYGIVKSIVAAK